IYGLGWSILALSWGLIAVGLGGGWLIGVAVREGVGRSARAKVGWAAGGGSATGAGSATSDEDARPTYVSVRGMSTLGALLGAGAWIVGSYVAFAVVQLAEGGAGLLDPARFGEFMTAALQLEPTWLQPAVLAGFVVAGWIGARSRPPRPAPTAR
ncbi:MAG TPA: hypothetical protein VH741_01610, partial [Candidatus Limnocylindrales bacterium]